MSDILGHDINGRPLRAGDRVVIEVPDPRWDEGPGPFIVAGPSITLRGAVVFREPSMSGGKMGAECETLRKLTDDHQKSEYTYAQLLDSLNKPVKAGEVA